MPKTPTQPPRTLSGLELREVYDAQSSPGLNPAEKPGEFPYTRGIHKNMYRGRLWTMRQYAGFGSAKEANERYRYLLAQGTTGLSVAFDLPTQMGRDSDHPRARGEVGRVGVAVSTVEDMEMLLQGIPLEQVSISMTINATAAILLGLVLVVAERRGVPWTSLRGTIQNDVLKEYIARGTYIYPPEDALRIVTDIFAFCSKEVPEWNTISVSGYHIREAGSTAIDEVAFTLGNGISYLEAAIAQGLSVDEIAPRLAFFFNCQIDFLEEVSKFRAARKLWAVIMRDRFGAKDPRSMMMRFHTQTAGSSLTAQQPLNNVVRTTVEALAAVFGGTQSLHTNSYDEALGLPTEESARLALRTQQILAHETGVAGIVDPLGGSYAIEAITAQIESGVLQRLAEIDRRGGMVRAIEEGFPQREIERSAYEFQQRVESGEQIIVGMNSFEDANPADPTILTLDPQIEIDQIARLADYRQRRDSAAVSAALENLRLAATGRTDLMPQILSALRVSATLGEISDILRGVYGEFRAGVIK